MSGRQPAPDGPANTLACSVSSPPCRSGFGASEARTLRARLTLSLFLSIFPLIRVAGVGDGCRLRRNPDFVTDTINSLNPTGDAQGIFTNAVNSAQANRGAVGLIGLLTRRGLHSRGSTPRCMLPQTPPGRWPDGVSRTRPLACCFGGGRSLIGSAVASGQLALLPGSASAAVTPVPFAVSVLLFGWMYWLLCRYGLTVRQVLPVQWWRRSAWKC
ncbi:MAG: hypothetical protein IPQ14_10280 [Candidatus Microthrix sp.]|uniref:hypothetical protein n=1 Tax=Candidatus Neomicrothrix sp. TaxID=2719034 RepID=UPI0025B94A22|nr:hypothetical protein [Candidatus Microthrix sp.]MBL0204690.1 hypothetical protein [Candidatus Microthrix sp.]